MRDLTDLQPGNTVTVEYGGTFIGIIARILTAGDTTKYLVYPSDGGCPRWHLLKDVQPLDTTITTDHVTRFMDRIAAEEAHDAGMSSRAEIDAIRADNETMFGHFPHAWWDFSTAIEAYFGPLDPDLFSEAGRSRAVAEQILTDILSGAHHARYAAEN